MLIDTNDILNKLKDKYPNKLPTNVIDSDVLAMLIGQQRVIDYLEALIISLETKAKPKVGK